jgi:hypothetical protein
MLQPMLFIGLGGAGGKTIRALKLTLERELIAAGHTSGIPIAWQFLHIDVVRDGINFPAPLMPDDEFLKVAPAGIRYADMVERLKSLGDERAQQEILSGWAIPASPINIGMGAGQVRAIGRLAGLASAQEIRNALEHKITLLNSPTAMVDLTQLSMQLKVSQPIQYPKAFIFSSLTGGLGSGIFSDVKKILESCANNPWTSNPTSFLYTADVFESIRFSQNQMTSNMLGAINEIVSDQFNSVSSSSELLFQMLGLPPSAIAGFNNSVRETHFLVGARSISGFDISNGPTEAGMDHVFRVVGESLAGVLTNDRLAFWLESISNLSSDARLSVDLSGLAPSSQSKYASRGFLGIGFNQITVGSDKLLNYVADAITKEQVRALLWPDLDFDFAIDDPARISMVKSQAATSLKFLSPTERDEEVRFDVHLQDSIVSELVKSHVAQFSHEVIVKNLPEKSQDVETFSRSIIRTWLDESESHLAKCKEDVSSNAAKWIVETQETLLQKIAQSIIADGFAAVIEALDELIRTIEDEYVHVARREYSEYEAVLKGLNPNAFQRRLFDIYDGIKSISSSDQVRLLEIENSVRKMVGMEIEKYALSLSLNIFSDISEKFLQPIRNSLIDARFELLANIKSDMYSPMEWPNFTDFPEWGSAKVPGKYLPSTGERILIQPSDYERLYESNTEHRNDGKSAFSKSISASFMNSVITHGLSSGSYEQLIQGEKWITGVREAQTNIGEAPQSVAMIFQTNLSSLRERNRRWLQEKNTSFNNFINLSISEYVEELGIDPVESQQRTTTFLLHFQQLAYRSSPLLSVNSKALTHFVSSNNAPIGSPLIEVTKVPFGQNSTIGKTCLQILNSFGIDTSNQSYVDNIFDPLAKVQSIWALSATKGKLPYWAIESLTDPILRKVHSSQSSMGTWLSFWEGRRTRPLLDSIPLEGEIRRSIITGWFIAALLGMRKIEAGPFGRSAQILNPYSISKHWSSLPTPLLENSQSDAKQLSWMLPGVLSSVSIALSAFGRTGNHEHIESYLLLKHFGREVTTQLKNRDSWDLLGIGDELPDCEPQKSRFISEWVLAGELPAGASKALPILQEQIDSGAPRKDALIEVITTLESEYNKFWTDLKEVAWFMMPGTWELRDELNLAFNDLREYIHNLS